jgi:hypothetical protein
LDLRNQLVANHCVFLYVLKFRQEESYCKGTNTMMMGKSEQFVLYIRTLHLLTSALRLAKDELEESRLRPSAAVKKVCSGTVYFRFISFANDFLCVTYGLILCYENLPCLQVVAQLNDRFKTSFAATKQLYTQTSQNMLVHQQHLSADRILYNHAIEVVS